MRLALTRKRALSWARIVGIVAVCIWGASVFVDKVELFLPVEEWLGWTLLPLWGYTIVFNVACVCGGSAVVETLFGRKKLPALEFLLQSMAAGLVLFALGIYFAGFICRLDTVFAVILPLLLILVGFESAPNLWRALSAWRNSAPAQTMWQRVPSAVAVGLGAGLILFMYLEALSPSAVNFDAKWYHIPTAQDYARVGCIMPLPGDDHRTFPHLTSIVQSWALLVPKLSPLPARWMLILHLEFSIVIWRIVGLAAAVAWMVDKQHTRGIWLAFFLFPSIFIYDQNIGGSADHYLGFFALPILLAFARTVKRFEWRRGVFLGMLLGGHILTKYQAVYVFGAVTAVGVVRWAYLAIRRIPRLRREGDPSLRQIGAGIGAIVLATALVSWNHFGKNWLFYNNPLYPFAQDIFTESFPKASPGFYQVVELPKKKKKEEPKKEQQEEEAEDDDPMKRRRSFKPQGEGWERQKWVANLLFEYSFRPANRHHTKSRPYIGSLFSLLLPCLLFISRSRRIWLTATLALIAFFAWGNLGPNDRYMLAFSDLLIATTTAIMVRIWDHGWVARLALLPVVGLQAFWGGDVMIYYGEKQMKKTRALISKGYAGNELEERLQHNAIQQEVTKETPEDAVILVRNYKNLMGLDRFVLNDVPSNGGYISYSRLNDARATWMHFRDRGVTHLLYPPRKRAPPRWNNIVLFAEMFHHYGRNKRDLGGLMLAELSPEPPPLEGPYLVLTRYVFPYPDGIYRVEQLDAWGYRRARFKPMPFPMKRLRVANTAELAARAHAVIRCKAPSEELSEALKSFHSVEKFRRCEVYLRRR